MKITVFGQALIHHPVTWPDAVRDLAQGSDAVICNFEGCLPPDGAWPMKRKTIHAAHAQAPHMLAGLGVTHLALANNHMWDYGHAGILSTRAAIERTGIVAAGAGLSGDEAAAPALRNGVALLSADAGPTPDWAIAGPGPGVNAIAIRRQLCLPAGTIAQLSRIAADTGEAQRRARRQAIGYDRPETGASFYGIPLLQADHAAEVWQADPQATARLVRDIQAARRKADVVLVAIHYHHWAVEWSQAPDWLSQLATELMAAGADGVIGTGPPVVAPVAVHGSRVFAPGLGNLVFHTARGAGYDRLNIPVWQGTALQYDNGVWSAHPVDVLRPPA